MRNNDPILIVEDDFDDCEFIQSALKSIGVQNEQKCFADGEAALEYLANTKEETFLILCDINMPKMNGIELKKVINKNNELRRKSIPFIYFTTSQSTKDINEAYDQMVQGFFRKPNNLEEIKDILKTITSYWDICRHPKFN